MAEKKKKKKSRLKRIFKNLAKVAALGTVGYGASKLFGGRRSPVSTVGQAVGTNRMTPPPAHLGETFHPTKWENMARNYKDRIMTGGTGTKLAPEGRSLKSYIPFLKKGGRVTGIAKRGFGRALMKGKK